MTTIDFDDFAQENNRLDLLWQLKTLRRDLKVTVFAIPGLGTTAFWEAVPDWIELAVHGWAHPTPRECERWSYNEMAKSMNRVHPRFVHGFKAPGWQISNGCYEWLRENDWWVADQDYNDERRPPELPVYKIDGWHGHIQDVCGNGLAETLSVVSRVVLNADAFRFASEAVT